MATRKPLVVVSGVLSELIPGDTVEGVVLTTALTAGSGLSGGGSLSSSQRVDVSLAAAPSGLIFVGNQLGLDGTAQASGNSALSAAATAQASGNAALASAATAQTSGNAALSRAGGTMTGPIVFANGQQINTSVNLSGGISGAVAYQSAPSSTAFLNPGISGQVLTTAGSNQAPVWATPAGGKILQAVQGTLTTYYNTSSTTFVNPNLALTITPSSASSRILLTASFGINKGNYGQTVYGTFFRNGTNVVSTNGIQMDTSYYYYGPPFCYSYIDSPSTTSSINYSVGVRTSYSSFYVNYDLSGTSATATLIALEIGP
jgi:hypothetical protein